MPNKKIVLHFPKNMVNQPIVYRLIKEYNLSFNILKAKILPAEEGLMVMELTGSEKDYERGIEYLKSSGVTIQPLSKDIKLIENKCTHCGACVVMCPADALKVSVKDRTVIFDSDKCIACELCIEPCPTRAMVVHF